MQVFQTVCLHRSELVHLAIYKELSWNIEINIYNKEAGNKHFQQSEISFHLFFMKKMLFSRLDGLKQVENPPLKFLWNEKTKFAQTMLNHTNLFQHRKQIAPQ